MTNIATPTGGMVKFAAMIDTAPFLQPYWNVDAYALDQDALVSDMGAWSHGERLFAQFVVSVWNGKDAYGFDFVEAAGVLDRRYRDIVAAWITSPFRP